MYTGDRFLYSACARLYARQRWTAFLVGTLVGGAGHGAAELRDVRGRRLPHATLTHLGDSVLCLLRCLLLRCQLPQQPKLLLLPQL